MPKPKTKQPAAGGVFTEEDYWFLGKTMALSYEHALRRRAAAVNSDDARDERGTRSQQRVDLPLDENGCRNAVAEWVEKGTYRSLIHRHDGTFTAADESERKYMRADTIPLLADALLNWPVGAVELPQTHYVRLPERQIDQAQRLPTGDGRGAQPKDSNGQ